MTYPPDGATHDFNPADPMTWHNAAEVRESQQRLEALYQVKGSNLRGPFQTHSAEQLKRYDQAIEWLSANRKLDLDDPATWPLSQPIVNRALKLQNWLTVYQLHDPQSWIVPADVSAEFQNFCSADLENPASYLPAGEIDPQSDVAVAARAQMAMTLAEQHGRIWEETVVHRSTMVHEMSVLRSQAVTEFERLTQKYTATVHSVEAEFLDHIQWEIDQVLNRFVSLARDAREQYEVSISRTLEIEEPAVLAM